MFFSKDSQIFVNHAGTANAFLVESATQTKLWCLPGPPQEIEKLWNDSIEASIKAQFPAGSDSRKLLRWHCLGQSEAALGEIVEQALAGSNLQTGYRPHSPYVEVKVWSPASELAANALYFKRLEKAIAPWLISRDDESAVASFLVALQRFDEVSILDVGTYGGLSAKLHEAMFATELWSDHVTVVSDWDVTDTDVRSSLAEAKPVASDEALILALGGLKSDGSWQVGSLWLGEISVATLRLPLGRRVGAKPSKRAIGAQTELSLIHWVKAFTKQLN